MKGNDSPKFHQLSVTQSSSPSVHMYLFSVGIKWCLLSFLSSCLQEIFFPLNCSEFLLQCV